MNQSLILANYKEELEKVAATAALKAIRALVNAGNIAKAESLAAKLLSRGALKTSKQGSQLRFLGSGSEGPAHLVIGAKDAPGRVLVRKALDPKGAIFSKQQAATKFNMMRRLRAKPAADGGHAFSRGSDSFAKLVSNKLHKTPSGGRYYHSEFVPGKDLLQTAQARGGLPRVTKDALPGLHDASVRAGGSRIRGRSGSSIKDAIKGRASSTGAALERSNPTNIMVTPSGKPKIVDFYVSPKNALKNSSELKSNQGFRKALAKLRARPQGYGPEAAKPMRGSTTRTVKGGKGAGNNPYPDGKALRNQLNRLRTSNKYLNAREAAAAWRARVPGANTTVADVPARGGLRSADVVNTLRGLGPGSPRAGGSVARARWTGAQPKGAGSPPSQQALLDARNQELIAQQQRRLNPDRFISLNSGVTRPARPGAVSGVDLPPVDPFGATVPRGLQFAKTQLARSTQRGR